MPLYSPSKIIIFICCLWTFFLGAASFLFAQEKSDNSYSSTLADAKVELTELQRQARVYRTQGLEAQQRGDTDQAMTYYQKATTLDPYYAVAFNDVGVIYEARGETTLAEASYLKAIAIDPYYLSSYSNLAMLYEGKRELKRAVYYWKKRVEFGIPGDPWTYQAIKRLADIQTVLGERSVNSKEEEVINLMKDVLVKKTTLRQDDKKLAADYFEKAKLAYRRGDQVGALKEAMDAKTLDPANSEVDDFLEKVTIRLLSK